MVRWPQHKAEDNEVTDSNNMRLVFKAPTQERPQLAYLAQSRCFPLKARSSTLKIILIKCTGWLQARDDRNKLRAHAKEKRSAAKKVPPPLSCMRRRVFLQNILGNFEWIERFLHLVQCEWGRCHVVSAPPDMHCACAFVFVVVFVYLYLYYVHTHRHPDMHCAFAIAFVVVFLYLYFVLHTQTDTVPVLRATDRSFYSHFCRPLWSFWSHPSDFGRLAHHLVLLSHTPITQITVLLSHTLSYCQTYRFAVTHTVAHHMVLLSHTHRSHRSDSVPPAQFEIDTGLKTDRLNKLLTLKCLVFWGVGWYVI